MNNNYKLETFFHSLQDDVDFMLKEMMNSVKTLSGQPAEERFIDIVCQPLHDSTGSVSGIFAQGIDKTNKSKNGAAENE